MNSNIVRHDRHQVSMDQEDLRLVCFPQAGNDGSIFSSWANSLPSDIALYRVVLPGRGRQFDEAPLTEFAAAKALLVGQISALTDRPLILVGHSLGALLAFETAHALGSQPNVLRCLVVAGCPAPRKHCSSQLSALSDDVLIRRLLDSGSLPVPPGLLAEMLELALPAIRADLALYDSYTLTHSRKPLDCPLLALSGDDDGEASISSMADWRLETSNVFQHEVFPGDHGFIEAIAEPSIELALTLAACNPPFELGAVRHDP